MPDVQNDRQARVLILTVHHGFTHVRMAQALAKALIQLRPNLKVEVIDTLAHCAGWFRAYYNAYEIPLKYWPALWDFIESRQYDGETTGPWWLYRWGARPLFRFIDAFAPDVVAATEVGLGEMAVLHKREHQATYSLVGMGTFVFEKPWVQPEVDLFLSYPEEVSGQLRTLGVPSEKIIECGVPVDPAFGRFPERPTMRASLGLDRDLPVLLVNFGGSGKAKPREVISALHKIKQPFQVVFMARRDQKLRQELLQLSAAMPHARVLAWVDNMHDWMTAADLLLSRAGGGIVAESMNSGLPIVVFDAPPGNERRICELIEKKWQTGYWLERPNDIAAKIEYLFTEREELGRLRSNARQRSYPNASRDGALAILRRLDQRKGNDGRAPN